MPSKSYDRQVHWKHKARYDARQIRLKQRIKELEAENKKLKQAAPELVQPVQTCKVWGKPDLQALCTCRT